MSKPATGRETRFLPGKSTRAIGLLGTLFCVLVVLAPDLFPAIVGRPGMVWTPINSPQYRFGDAYYYTAWVAEILRSGIPPSSPSAAELAGQPLLESVRWFPLAVAALPGLLIRDFRFVYMIDFAFTAAVLFFVPYRLAWEQLGSRWGGFLAGSSVLFFIGQWWSELPIAPGVYGPPSFFSWLSSIYSFVTSYAFQAFFNIYESETLQGSFRFINNSMSGPLLLIYLYGCFRIYSKDRISAFMAAWVFAMSLAMAFSYPSRVLTAYFVLAGLAVFSILRGKWNAAVMLFSIGLCTILVLLLGGYVSYVRHVFAVNELWNNIFEGQSKSFIERPLFNILLIVAANKYVLSLAVAVLLAWRYRDLRDLITVVGLLACGLAGTYLFDMPQFWSRFLDRGVDHAWFMCLLLSLVAGWKTWVEPSFPRAATRAFALPVMLLIVVVPLRGFVEYALANTQNDTRFMTAGRWEALRWIDRNAEPGATIAALDWEDITFIPIFTHAKLAVDNMIIGGRSPADEVQRYVSVWKLLGFDRDILKARLNEMVSASVRRRSLKLENFRHPPLSPGEDFPASQIAEAAIYWPYVGKLDSFDVATAANTTNPALVDRIMSMYDKVDPERVVGELGIKYVLLSGNELQFNRTLAAASEVVFENATHKLYAIRSAASR